MKNNNIFLFYKEIEKQYYTILGYIGDNQNNNISSDFKKGISCFMNEIDRIYKKNLK